MQHHLTLLAPLILFLYSCSGSSSFSSTDRDSLAATHGNYIRMVSADPLNIDYESYVKGHYAEDAVLMFPNGPAIKGHAEIIQHFKNLPFKFSRFNVEDTQIEGSGDMAFIQGNYDMTLQFNDSMSVNDKGKYLEVWKKNKSGEWKCIRDISNSDLPINQ
jgi:ketosteroid isomerase-like protein